MKKITSLFLLSLFSTSALAAPTKAGSASGSSNVRDSRTKKIDNSFLQLGAIVGASSSNWAGVEPTTGKFESLTGYTAGGQIIMGKEQLQFETGVYSSERGVKWTGAFDNLLEVEYKIKYIDIPLLAKYSFQQRSQSSFFIKGGALIGLLQSAESNGVIKDFGGFKKSSNIKDQLNSTDLRYSLSGGGDIKLSKNVGLSLELNYQISNGAINKEKGTDNIEIRNTATTLSTGLIFDI
jgi:hypothetical protein